MKVLISVLLIVLWTIPIVAQNKLLAGVGKADITPPVGTPLAGYGARRGGPSIGVHDPVEARALVIDNGVEKMALVGVDHLGYDHAMVRRVQTLAAAKTQIKEDHIFVMSSHTHSGGGAYLEVFPILAGKYDSKIRAFYEERAAEAIIAAHQDLKPVRIAIGSGSASGISRFRSSWPPNGPVDPEVGVIRVDDASTRKPMAILMNFAAHPTVLGANNFQFSADYVGYARKVLERLVDGQLTAIFANGAQGTIAPRAFQGKDEWARAQNIGTLLAAEVFKILHTIEPQDWTEIKLTRTPLTLKPQLPPSFPAVVKLPETQESEVNAIMFDGRYAFVTIPGELSSIINMAIKERGKTLGFEHTFLLGLTNDALGYIITEDEYRHKTYESTISLFGPHFGSLIMNEAFLALEKLRPPTTKK
jgi:hypothetical protein